MRCAFTTEQDMFRDTVRDLFDAHCPPSAIRAAGATPDGRIPGLWSALAEMGVLAALAPEATGGLGMDEVDVVRLMEEAGYHAVPEPLVEHVLVAVPALAGAGSELVVAAIDGSATVTVGFGTGPVGGATIADAVIRIDGPTATLEPAPTVVPAESIDSTRQLGVFAPAGPTATPLAVDTDLAFDRAALGTAAQSVGIARRLLDATVSYVGERRQFGKPVGSYQAVKHQLADVRMAVAFAAPLVHRAAWSVAHPDDHPPSIRGRDVSAAKAASADAVDQAGRAALQCHGAIGYTDEYDLQFWLKRAWTSSAAHGDARFHRDRVARALGL